MQSSKIIVRPFKEKNRESIRAICKRTGQKGHPTRLFFEHEEIVLILFANYYMDYEPESCFVAEEDGRELGHKILSIKRSTMRENVTGKRWYAKLLACDLRQPSEGVPDASSEY